MKVAPEETPFVVLQVPDDSQSLFKATQTAFEIFNVPALFYDATAHCAMYNTTNNLDAS